MAVLVAVTVTVMLVGVLTLVGAVYVTFAVVGPVGVMVRANRAGVPVCEIAKVSGVPGGLLGSDAVTAKDPANPEVMVWFAIGLTVGARPTETFMVVFEVELPPQLVAVSVRVTGVSTDTMGAV